MRSAGLAIAALLAPPAHGYVVVPRPSSLGGRSAFVGRTSAQQRLPLSPIARRRDHALFYAAADVHNDTAGVGVEEAAPSSPPKALGTSGDWSAYLDESKGLIYYFNPRTGESKWEPPADADFSGVQSKIGAAKKVEMRERLKSYLEDRLSDSSAADFVGAMHDDRKEAEWRRREAGERLEKEKKRVEKMKLENKAVTKKAMPTKKAGGDKAEDRELVAEWEEWQARMDAKRGQVYYYSKKTRESRWERPEGFPEPKLSASRRIAMEEQSRRYAEWNNDAAVETDAPSAENMEEPASEARTAADAMADRRDSSNSNRPSSLPIVQQGEWSAFFDIKSGLVFYYNEESGKTSWDPPYDDFPRIVMEGTTPRVLDTGNISMERALGYIGMDEMAEAVAWEEAKKKERARKAALRAEKAKAEGKGKEVVDMYETAKKSEMERLEQERKANEEEKRRQQQAEMEAAAKLAEEEKLRREQIAAEEKAAKERAAAAKLAIERNLEQERLEKERLEMNRQEKQRLEAKRMAAEEAKQRETAAKLAIEQKLEQERLEKERMEAQEREKVEAEFKQPALPKDEPKFTAETVETMVAPLKTSTLYDILNCSPDASRMELKRSYLSLAKETHPDARLQYGMENNDESERRFVEISNAWKILGDSQSRRRYDRELRAKSLSSNAGSMFENWVVGAAKAMDEALAKAEDDL